ncbi:MAG: RagB/SusD family nutrient uptake outer membrane protein [Bacteroidota bacterium]
MKNFNIYITAGLVGLLVTTSCKKLNLTPPSQIPVSLSFQSVKDAKIWDTGLYGLFRGIQNGSYVSYSDVQGDQLNATLDFGNRSGSPHRWDLQGDDQTIAPMWAGYYNVIANINTAIAGFKTITPASTAETAQLNQYTGDMYLARAYCYHKLITRWAKPYETATAATDLGVPLITVFDLNGAPPRASVKAVYDQILADITTAKTLLASVAGTQGAKTFTIDVAVALEARVRLYMHDYTGAYTAAQSLITANKYPLITTAAALQTYWYTDGVQESIYQPAASLTELPAAMALYLSYKSGNSAYDPDFVPTQGIYDLYPVGDIRKTTYFALSPVKVGSTSATIQLVNKYPGNPALYTGTFVTSNYVNAPKVFRIGEIYTIAAEAAIGAGSEPNAITALTALRVARGETPVVATGAALVQAVRDERTRELAFEGFRLDDLTRWHLGFTRLTPQITSIIYTGAAYNLQTQVADANKFVWPIPSNDLTINKNLIPNPGY